MQLRFSFLTVLIFIFSAVQSQSYFFSVFTGDTVSLYVHNANGSVQWQQAEDSLGVWTDIPGATTNPFVYITETSQSGFIYYRAKIINPVICLEPWYSTITRHRLVDSLSQIPVGDYYAGGIVFFNSDSLGLIAAPHDQSAGAQWGCSGTSISAASGQAVGTGKNNTAVIVAACTTPGIAARLCADLNLNGYSDWYLPSKDELNLLYQSQSIFGSDMTWNVYWSSSNYDLNTAWAIYFGDGFAHFYLKNNAQAVRAIRSFCPLPSQANAGPDQLNLSGTTANLAANNPSNGTGLWTIISGVGGSFADSSLHNTIFSGTVGVTYQLVWTISNACGQSTSDTVVVSFEIPNCGIITDVRDGNTYQTVQIGNQCWMAENLRYLPSVVGPGTASPTTPYYYVYGYNDTLVNDAKATANYTTYGVLYNWAAAMNSSASSAANPSGVQGVCPAGWHLPSDAEWTQLTDSLGGQSVAGGKLKETGTTHWSSPNTAATNETYFTALPGGYRYYDGAFYGIGNYGLWWSATENNTYNAWDRTMYYDYSNVNRDNGGKELGFSVRCIKSPPPPSVQQRLDQGETPKQIYDSGMPLDSLYGKTFEGGLIFYLDTLAGSGLVAAPSDQSTGAEWGCSGTSIPGASGIAIGSGAANTAAIVAGCAETNRAARICYEHTDGTYSDWFLPSIVELNAMYTNLHQKGFGSFANANYWSSTEVSATGAFGFSFLAAGGTLNALKSNTISFRAVRAFGLPPSSPTQGTHTVSPTQIIWQWNTVPGATGYKYNTTNDYATATNVNTDTFFTQTGLSPQTAYTLYVWAYNANGNSAVATFNATTAQVFNCGQSFIDSRDGNTYQTVLIGNQCWMAENLRYLPSVVGPNTGSETTPYYYVYGYNGTVVNDAKATANYTTYGVLYNWAAAMNNSASSAANPSGVQGVCPAGWHLPSDAEWTELTDYLGGTGVAGGKLKATTLWSSPNTGATNETGFTALPGGSRFNQGVFSNIGSNGNWWSATDNYTNTALYRNLYYNNSNVNRNFNTKGFGFSVRCVKQAPPHVQQRLNQGETPKQIFDTGMPLDSLYGKTFEGGLIFYLDTLAGSGLVAAPSDQSTGAEWGCSGTSIPGASGTAIGTGAANTAAIVAGCAETNRAARICNDYTDGTYSDWFLPSKDELNAIYNNLKVKGFGGFASSYYWSSTEYSNSNAWNFDFNGGHANGTNKFNTFRVRAVRAF